MNYLDEFLQDEESAFGVPKQETYSFFDPGVNTCKVKSISINSNKFIEVVVANKSGATHTISFRLAKLPSNKENLQNRINSIVNKNILQLLKGSNPNFQSQYKKYIASIIGDNMDTLFSQMKKYLQPVIDSETQGDIDILVTMNLKGDVRDDGYYWKKVDTSSFFGLTIFPSDGKEYKLDTSKGRADFINSDGELHPAFCRKEDFLEEGWFTKLKPDDADEVIVAGDNDDADDVDDLPFE